jgi:di/tricarboxylate transporter
MPSQEVVIVLGILAAAIALFALGRPRADIVAVLVVLALTLSGVLAPHEALAGFGDPVVVLIAAVSIVGEGLVATGVAYRLGEAVMKIGGSNEARLIALVMTLAACVGAFMSSSAIVAMFIPVVITITHNTGLNPKRMLMPLAVAALISGMMTLIASSPNLIVDQVLRQRGMASLAFFSWTPFGIAILVVSIVFILMFGRGLLSRRLTAEDSGAKQSSALDLLRSYGLADQWYRLQICLGSALADRTIARTQLPDRFGIVLVGVEKHPHAKMTYLPASPGIVLEANDAIFVVGTEERASALIASENLALLPGLTAQHRREALHQVGIAEIMLTPDSHMIDRTLRDLDFRSRHGVNVLSIRHRGQPSTAKLDDQKLDYGDTLLVSGGWTEIRRLRDDRENFVVLTLPVEYSELIPAPRQAPIAVAILVVMILLMAFRVMPNAVAALLAALALLATNCVRLDAIYRNVNWKTVVVVAGTLPLGMALAKTGATDLMVKGLGTALDPFGPVAMLSLLFLVTAGVGMFISNAATAVLMAPIAIDTAQLLHRSPHAFAMVVAIASCAGYPTPVSSAVNMLVMEPGGYGFSDYFKLGMPLLFLTMLVTVGLCAAFYVL